MIDDAPYNHYVRCYRGLSFHPDLDLSLDALHPSGPSYHTSEEVVVTLTAAHLLRLATAAAADALDEEALACLPGSPLHFSSKHID